MIRSSHGSRVFTPNISKDHRPALTAFQGKPCYKEAPCKETQPKHNIMFVNHCVLSGVLKINAQRFAPTRAAKRGKSSLVQLANAPPSLQRCAICCVPICHYSILLLPETFFSLEAKCSSPPINHFAIFHLTSEQTEAQVLHVLIFKYMLTSNIT